MIQETEINPVQPGSRAIILPQIQGLHPVPLQDGAAADHHHQADLHEETKERFNEI